jgi:hypothetical protein
MRFRAGSFIIASYAACSCFLIASMGSLATLDAMSLLEFAFELSAINPSSPASFFIASVSDLCTKPSSFLFPSKYPSISSLTPPPAPGPPAPGPLYIQSTRSVRFLPPAASCSFSSSRSARSSARSFKTWSVFLRSSSALFSSAQTRFWFDMSTGCHDFFKLRSPPMLTGLCWVDGYVGFW